MKTIVGISGSLRKDNTNYISGDTNSKIGENLLGGEDADKR